MWLKKKTTVTSARPTDQQMKGAHQHHVHTSKVRKTILPFVATKLPKGGKASFRPPELFTKQGGTQTNRRNTLILKKAHQVQKVSKIEGSDRPTHSHYSLSLHFSQHNPLLKSHSPSMLRERLQERGYRPCVRNHQKKTWPSLLAPPPLLQTGLLGQPYLHTSLSSGEESSCGDRSRHMLSLFRLGCRARVQPLSNSSK